MTELIKILDTTFRPPPKLLEYIQKSTEGKKISQEAQRWLSVWPHWEAWLIELEKRASDQDEKLLAELASILEITGTPTHAKNEQRRNHTCPQ